MKTSMNENVASSAELPNRTRLGKSFKTMTLAFAIFLFSIQLLIEPSNADPISTENQSNTISFSSSSSESSTTDPKMKRRQEFVQKMALEAWDGYSQFAWGHEALLPVTKKAYAGSFGNDSGLTIVNSMSTLWTMGLMEQFEKGKTWIDTKLNFDKILKSDVPVFDSITSYVGGLLSCYALTGDVMFLNKAKEIALMMEPAFANSKGIPYQHFSKSPSNKSTTLSSIAGFQVDYYYLSDVTGDRRYRNHISAIRSTLNEAKKPRNLFFNSMDSKGEWDDNKASFFTNGKESYSNLIKSYIQSNLGDVESIQMYKEALDAMDDSKLKVFSTSVNGSQFTQEYYDHPWFYFKAMEQSACHLGGMLSMGANSMKRALNENSTDDQEKRAEDLKRIDRHWLLAKRLTETCRNVKADETGLTPNMFFFLNKAPRRSDTKADPSYDLKAELAESYFYLWRLTDDVKYRDYAWELAQAINLHCQIEGSGYSGIENVHEIPTRKTDYQNPDFLGATLKYLYLTFSDSLLPLDQWVFNAKGHPLPICGTNSMYPADQCNKV